MRKLLCLLLPLTLAFAPGCTLIGAAGGGAIAARSHHEDDVAHEREGEPVEEHSLLPGVAVGAGIGLLVDALVMAAVIRSFDDSWSYEQR